MSRQAAAKFLQIFLKIIQNSPKVPGRRDVTGSDKGKSRGSQRCRKCQNSGLFKINAIFLKIFSSRP
jgi:hypothetical protein